MRNSDVTISGHLSMTNRLFGGVLIPKQKKKKNLTVPMENEVHVPSDIPGSI